MHRDWVQLSFQDRLCDTILSLRDKSEKQEGSVLAQRYVIGLLRKAPVYGVFGRLVKKANIRFLMEKCRQPSKTKEFLMEKWTKDTKKNGLPV
ncbi:MAG: hypothetical protein H2058_04140 [Muricauda sp.]|nr:hypothetical protein [Allomuricauda sp.]MBA4744428.1 hypothetical protein [Allomuricauda sp.]